MFLKSIEVQGFKSFANRHVFEFDKGITGIVGPNGSGKSNVADAVRWVLGEQSAKQLRGSKMEDVIFSGTASRKALGFAYVGITLDNSDRSLPVSYDDVTVSRRVFRSGESEYKINGHSCRLRDIQEMFFDTGIGKEGYSIIGQGQIDKILSGKPEDRRELFDEAAGIVKYKKRKASAMKDLDAEEQNISRVEDILRELEAQLSPLKQESEKAAKYLSFKDELKKIDANIYLITYKKLKDDADKTDERLSIVQGQINDAQKEYEEIKAAYSEIEELMEQYDRKISSLMESSSVQAVELQRLEGNRELLKSKKDAIKSRMSLSSSQQEDLREKIKQKEEQILGCKDSLESLLKEHELSSEKEKESSENLESVRARIAETRAEIERLGNSILEYINIVSEAKSRMERNSAIREQNTLRRSQISSQLLSLRSEAESEESLVTAFRTEEEQIDLQLSETVADIDKSRDMISKATSEIVGLRNLLEKKQKEFHESSAKYITLKNINERYEGYGGSIRRVMEKKDEEKGLVGVVADIIRTGKKYEIAIETALGGNISNIVTEDEDTARRMIEYLKENRFGRATFLPLTSIRAKEGDEGESLEDEKGYIGRADKLIETEERYSEIAAYLLGRIFVVDNIDNALKIARKNRYRLRIVTLGGESLMPGGSISGGAYKKSGNLLARHREMDELKETVASLEKEIEKLSKSLSEHREKREKSEKKLEELGAVRERLELQKNTVQIRLKQVSDSFAEHDKNISEMEKELGLLNLSDTDIEKLSGDISLEIEEADKKRQEAEGKSSELSTELEKLNSSEKELQEYDTGLQVAHSALEQKLDFSRSELDRFRREQGELEDELKSLIKQRGEAGRESEKLSEDEEKLESDISARKSNIDRCNKSLSTAQQEKERYTREHKSFFEKREKISETLSSLDREQVRLASSKEKIEDRRTQLSNYMWEEYELTYRGAGEYLEEELQAETMGNLRKRQSDLRSSVRQLGDVNVSSIEQYKNVSERYDLMKSQHDDLVEARDKISGIIDSLNRSMKKQFAERFELINQEFARAFSQLFGGGNGSLTLSEPDDLLETGVIITAQPPGKKLQNMMQLSGGEKALTAIALLFAIQNLKPSPFCLLDEIEAALDDANIKRFAEYLNELTKDTQFIVITHRRGTMRVADVLYGITMQEKGISTIVSVNLIESQLSK